MSYNAEISRVNPGLFGIIIDQSGSMEEKWKQVTKSVGTADAVNNILRSIIDKNTKGENILDRFEIFVLGYGNPDVDSAIDAIDISDYPVKLSVLESKKKITQKPQIKIIKEPDGVGGIIETTKTVEVKIATWVVPNASYGTPGKAAFEKARDIIENWIGSHPTSFPPILINITDGQFSDGDPTPITNDIQNLSTQDGNVLVFNIHISSDDDENSLMFPGSDDALPSDPFAQMLFDISSTLTPGMISAAREKGFANVKDNSRGFAYNADIVNLIEFLDIGTRTPADR